MTSLCGRGQADCERRDRRQRFTRVRAATLLIAGVEFFKISSVVSRRRCWPARLVRWPRDAL